MKKLLLVGRMALVLFTCIGLLQGCLKDTATRTYTLYTPVYKTVAEVRGNIKSDAPVSVKNPGKIFVLGNYIFLNEIDKGVHVIDNSNPAAPVNKYFIAIPGNLDLAVKGKILYADNYKDLVTLDISNPDKVQVKKISENVFPRRQYLNGFIGDTTRVIVDWIKKDTTVANEESFRTWENTQVGFFTAADAASLSATKNSAPGVGGSMARFTLLNNYLYTVTDNDLNVFNIAAPENPVFTNSIQFGWGIETIYPFKNNLFIGSQTGMFIFNTANPAQPAQLAQYTHFTACDPVIADDNFAYVTLRSGTRCRGAQNQLDVLNIQNIETPWLIKSYPLTNPHGLSKSGNTLFICDGEAGLKVYDALDVNNLRLLQTVDGIDAFDVIAQNNNAIVVAKDGLYQYDYTNRSNVSLQSKISYVNSW